MSKKTEKYFYLALGMVFLGFLMSGLYTFVLTGNAFQSFIIEAESLREQSKTMQFPQNETTILKSNDMILFGSIVSLIGLAGAWIITYFGLTLSAGYLVRAYRLHKGKLTIEERIKRLEEEAGVAA